MSEDNDNKVKIRLKFRSGEEFEAEGTPSFIEKQRSEFLQLIGKEGKKQPSFPAAAATAAVPEAPALYRRKLPADGSGEQAAFGFSVAGADITPPGLAAAENIRRAGAHKDAERQNLWEQITRTDEGMVFLRRKSRLLTAQTAALLLIGAAKSLLGAENGYSALALSKSLAKSGYGGGRLDRVLAGEIRQGTLKAAGSKRSRAYLLSDEGFARAYVLANKLAEEWQ